MKRWKFFATTTTAFTAVTEEIKGIDGYEFVLLINNTKLRRGYLSTLSLKSTNKFRYTFQLDRIRDYLKSS